MEINLSKKKLVRLIIGSLVLTAGGLWMLISQPQATNSVFNNPFVKNGAAILGILLGPVGIYIAIKKWLDKKPGLIIDETGVTDNSSGVSAGLIPWKDIKEIREIKIFRQQMLLLIVQNPEAYINRQPNGLKRKGMESNYKHFGSPVSISAAALDCNFYELKNILQKRLADFREK